MLGSRGEKSGRRGKRYKNGFTKPREARERMIMQGTRHRGRAVMKGELKYFWWSRERRIQFPTEAGSREDRRHKVKVGREK